MRFRYISIAKLVFQLLRGNYALRSDYEPETQPQRTTFLYRLCLAICYVFSGDLQRYYETRSRWYMLVSCTPSYGQIERVLTYLYGYNITVTPSTTQTHQSYWYAQPQPKEIQPYLRDGSDHPVYLGASSNATEPIINIPTALYNNPVAMAQFRADLSVLVPFYIPVILKPY